MKCSAKGNIYKHGDDVKYIIFTQRIHIYKIFTK